MDGRAGGRIGYFDLVLVWRLNRNRQAQRLGIYCLTWLNSCPIRKNVIVLANQRASWAVAKHHMFLPHTPYWVQDRTEENNPS